MNPVGYKEIPAICANLLGVDLDAPDAPSLLPEIVVVSAKDIPLPSLTTSSLQDVVRQQLLEEEFEVETL